MLVCVCVCVCVCACVRVCVCACAHVVCVSMSASSVCRDVWDVSEIDVVVLTVHMRLQHPAIHYNTLQ